VDSDIIQPLLTENGTAIFEDDELLSISPSLLQIQQSVTFQLAQTLFLLLLASPVSLEALTEFSISVKDFSI
jgi:hypothetical protein